MPKPLMLYDGDCGFCGRWIERWKRRTGDAVDYSPAPDPITAVQLVLEDGQIIEGAQAVFKSLSYAPGRGLGLWAYENLPWFAEASELVYGIVARHRAFFSKLTDLLWGKSVEPPEYFASSWLFMRALGVINLIAFLSLGSQIDGLIGSGGILPLAPWLEAVKNQYGAEAHRILPTLFWLNSSDRAILLSCKTGAALSALLVLDLAPWFIPAALWALYLSLSLACREFLGFQWDILLLEINFLAIFLNPPRLWPRFINRSGPSCAVLFILHLVLFKLMFQSGWVKLLSGDPLWRGLTALTVHYETQPIPTWLGWYAHQLPVGFQRFSCLAMFGIELVLPFFIFFPRRMKLTAFSGLAGLQVLILLTGNYCFFNLMAIALCLLLLDDHILGRFFPRALLARLADRDKTLLPRKNFTIGMNNTRMGLLAPVAALLIFLNAVQITGTFRRRDYPAWMRTVLEPAAALRTVNSYGLFAVMTPSRPEIVIEGSNDGKEWKEYGFKWKPGDLSRRPPFVAPHQPRADWQMWFAALGDARQNPWFVNLIARLLEGSPPALALLDKNPFPDSPPLVIRATLFDYHFTDAAEKKAGGKWWKREPLRPYCPPLSLRRGK
ncbi:MAG: hypothetical protein A3A86_07850 [Elusimicrobia bacterium RIFCSPLOWO2_01_FULL_60_11]|nr:MAG: hypothetical protein A3A86_07850 [Elusimicrobia bacterium RIFCSPLOWO2_01_FULL_60_11]